MLWRRSLFVLACFNAIFILGSFRQSLATPLQSVDPQAMVHATSFQLTGQLAGSATGTVVSNPTGISCAPTCSASYASGTQVKLTATANKGAFFAGWTAACKGRGTTCTWRM